MENNLEPRECEWCGEVFIPKRWWQKYCSPPKSCKDSAHNRIKCDKLRKRDSFKEQFNY